MINMKQIAELVVEFVGTFVLVSVILRTRTNDAPFKVAVVLAACLIAFSPYGPTHLNPALSMATMLKEQTEPLKIMAMVASQVAGAAVASQLAK